MAMYTARVPATSLLHIIIIIHARASGVKIADRRVQIIKRINYGGTRAHVYY